MKLVISVALPTADVLMRVTTMPPQEIYHCLTNLEYPIEILLSRDIDVDTRKWKQKEDSGFHFFEIPVVEEYKPTNIVFD